MWRIKITTKQGGQQSSRYIKEYFPVKSAAEKWLKENGFKKSKNQWAKKSEGSPVQKNKKSYKQSVQYRAEVVPIITLSTLLYAT